jgi:signal transduction histidine kinase
MTNPDNVLRILSFQGKEHIYEEIFRQLKNRGYFVQHLRASNRVELDSLLDLLPWNFVIYGPGFSDCSASEAKSLVRRVYPELPLVLIADRPSDLEDQSSLGSEIDDSIILSRPGRLLHTIIQMIKLEGNQVGKSIIQSDVRHSFMGPDQMLAIVSHDLKNPLSAIHLEAQMLLRMSENYECSAFSEEVKLQANRIIKTTSRIKDLISDLLDHSKIKEGIITLNKSVHNTGKIFQDVIDQNLPLLKEKKIKLNCLIPDNTQLEVDKAKISQVLNNLLSNAIKFSPEKGEIKIAILDQESGVEFHVRDNGPGIAASSGDQIFEKYWTSQTNGEGTGLGLFICKTIVDAHGGEIFAENLPGTGAHFWFKLPRVKGPIPQHWHGHTPRPSWKTHFH